MKANITIKIILDTRQQRKDGTYSVKIRVTFRRKWKAFPVKEYLTKGDFLIVESGRGRGKYNRLRAYFLQCQSKAQKIVDELQVFTFDAFRNKFYSQVGTYKDMFAYFNRKMQTLKEDDKIGTSNVYKGALRSLQSFHSKKTLFFEDVTPNFLKRYESWLMMGGKKQTTVSIYMRTVKAIFNDAIAKGEAKQELYPFGKGKYQPPQWETRKKSLALNQIKKIFEYEPESQTEAYYRDLWIFIYLCNGANVADIARLKHQNIDGDKIVFVRQKTSGTKRSQRAIVAYMNERTKTIIEKWGLGVGSKGDYIFPILTKARVGNKEDEVRKIRQATKMTNKYIKVVAGKVGIKENVTTYTARHSFATVLKRSGASIQLIQEALGHASLKTTQIYLDSFDDDFKKEQFKKLTDF